MSIKVNGISKWFGHHTVLDHMSFNVDTGKTIGLLGPNGAGKTTTMEIIAGILAQNSGSVEVNELTLLQHPLQYKKQIGYLPDPPALYEALTVREFLVFIGKLKDRTKSTGQQQAAVDLVQRLCALETVNKRLISQLSRGFRKRTAFAACLLHDPNILILDEPSKGLDPEQIIEMRHLIQSYHTHKTIFISSHILSEIIQICDQILILHNGKIAKFIDLTEEDLTLEKLESIYLQTSK